MIRTILFALLSAAPIQGATIAQVIVGIQGAYVYEVLPTGSMKPSFDETYVLLADDKPFREIQVNDIILFWMLHNGQLKIVCHRVWARSSGGSIVLTKGDANKDTDKVHVTEDMYVGRVIGWVKKDVLKEVGAQPVVFTLDLGAKGERISK